MWNWWFQYCFWFLNQVVLDFMADQFKKGVRIINVQSSTIDDGQTYGGRYLLPYVLQDLKWCKRDGLVTYIDQLRYSELAQAKEKWHKNHSAVNFDMINNEFRGDKLTKQIKECETAKNDGLQSYPEKE